jgi:hypothetical protein
MDNRSKPIGRPRVPLCEQRRNIVKSTLDDTEYEALLRMADLRHMSISDIIREGIKMMEEMDQ